MREVEPEREQSLAAYRGRSVKVAIVDGGIDSRHPKLGRIGGGVELAIGKSGRIISGIGTALVDHSGHGTACAGIVHRVAPAAELFSVRIGGEEAEADGRLVLAALRWAIEQHIDIICLAIGQIDSACKEEIEQTCRDAVAQRIIPLASAHWKNPTNYFALLPETIGVFGGEVRGYGGYYYRPQARVECIARGDAQRVCWLERSEVSLQDGSFAVAHMAGTIALMREKVPRATMAQIRKLLEVHALNNVAVCAPPVENRRRAHG